METPSTPPARRATRSTRPNPASPHTPEVTRRIEENRLKAKALRERSLALEAASSSSIAQPASLKRPHTSISKDSVPSTSRNATTAPLEAIQPASRKFKSYVDHDFSKMTDTRGGFLTAEDDPFNKNLHSSSMNAKEEGKPGHMTLKEWERHKLLKELRRTKSGPFEPAIVVGGEKGKCRECGSLEIDWVWKEVFGVAVCGGCKEKMPEVYSLLTKTEARDDYLLTDPELKDPALLPHLNKPNPHKSHWHDMMLYLRFQVEEYAFSAAKWGSPEALDAEFEKRELDKKVRKEAKFKSKLKELKKKTRTDAYRRNLAAGGKGGGNFGDDLRGGKHEHSWGQLVEGADGVSVKTCTECGMEVEEMEF